MCFSPLNSSVVLCWIPLVWQLLSCPVLGCTLCSTPGSVALPRREEELLSSAVLFLIHPSLCLAFFATGIHCWPAFNLSAGILGSFSAEFYPLSSSQPVLFCGVVPVLLQRGIPAQLQDFAFVFFFLFEIDSCLSIPVPLENNPPYNILILTVPPICKLARGALCGIVCVVNKDLIQHWPQYGSVEDSIRLTGVQLDFVLLTQPFRADNPASFCSPCTWNTDVSEWGVKL